MTLPTRSSLATTTALVLALASPLVAQQTADAVAPEAATDTTTAFGRLSQAATDALILKGAGTPVEADDWMVAAANPLAVQAGARVLGEGGTAADAMVADHADGQLGAVAVPMLVRNRGTFDRSLDLSPFQLAALAAFVGVQVYGTLGAYVLREEYAGVETLTDAFYYIVVTGTTVGYGDIAPQTVLGQTIAALLMILGYGIIAVPTGIVTAELAEASRRRRSRLTCPGCGRQGHDEDAEYCKTCGARLRD